MRSMLACICLLCIIKYMNAGGTFRFKLIRYSNQESTDYHRNCCKSYLPYIVCPSVQCNQVLDICIDQVNGKICSIFHGMAHQLEKGEKIVFGEKVGILNNPMLFRFDAWKGGFRVQLRLYDDGQRGRSIEGDDFSFNITNEPSTDGKQISTTAYLAGNITRLDVEYSVACDQNYYQDCTKYCHTDYKHYTCDQKGNRICMPGWNGEFCSERIRNCAGNPCLNSGSCVDQGSSYMCRCNQDYIGSHCETTLITWPPVYRLVKPLSPISDLVIRDKKDTNRQFQVLEAVAVTSTDVPEETPELTVNDYTEETSLSSTLLSAFSGSSKEVQHDLQTDVSGITEYLKGDAKYTTSKSKQEAISYSDVLVATTDVGEKLDISATAEKVYITSVSTLPEKTDETQGIADIKSNAKITPTPLSTDYKSTSALTITDDTSRVIPRTSNYDKQSTVVIDSETDQSVYFSKGSVLSSPANDITGNDVFMKSTRGSSTPLVNVDNKHTGDIETTTEIENVSSNEKSSDLISSREQFSMFTESILSIDLSKTIAIDSISDEETTLSYLNTYEKSTPEVDVYSLPTVSDKSSNKITSVPISVTTEILEYLSTLSYKSDVSPESFTGEEGQVSVLSTDEIKVHYSDSFPETSTEFLSTSDELPDNFSYEKFNSYSKAPITTVSTEETIFHNFDKSQDTTTENLTTLRSRSSSTSQNILDEKNNSFSDTFDSSSSTNVMDVQRSEGLPERTTQFPSTLSFTADTTLKHLLDVDNRSASENFGPNLSTDASNFHSVEQSGPDSSPTLSTPYNIKSTSYDFYSVTTDSLVKFSHSLENENYSEIQGGTTNKLLLTVLGSFVSQKETTGQYTSREYSTSPGLPTTNRSVRPTITVKMEDTPVTPDHDFSVTNIPVDHSTPVTTLMASDYRTKEILNQQVSSTVYQQTTAKDNSFYLSSDLTHEKTAIHNQTLSTLGARSTEPNKNHQSTNYVIDSNSDSSTVSPNMVTDKNPMTISTSHESNETNYNSQSVPLNLSNSIISSSTVPLTTAAYLLCQSALLVDHKGYSYLQITNVKDANMTTKLILESLVRQGFEERNIKMEKTKPGGNSTLGSVWKIWEINNAVDSKILKEVGTKVCHSKTTYSVMADGGGGGGDLSGGAIAGLIFGILYFSFIFILGIILFRRKYKEKNKIGSTDDVNEDEGASKSQINNSVDTKITIDIKGGDGSDC